MSNRAPRWEPGRNPVHRLVHCLDVLAIAFNRFRQCSFRLPSQREGVTVDPDGTTAYSDGANRLRAELAAVRDAICRPDEWTVPRYFAERLADEAVAAFVQRGAGNEHACQAVADAANWIGGVLTPWVVGTVRPWNYYVETVTDTPRPGERFDAEAAVITDYHQARRGLLSALATAGETVPPVINPRGGRASRRWRRGGTVAISLDQLLGLAREATPHAGTGDPPPAPRVSKVDENRPHLDEGRTPPVAGGQRRKSGGRPRLSESTDPVRKARHDLYRLVQAAMQQHPELRSPGSLYVHFNRPEYKDFRAKLTAEAQAKLGQKFFRAALKWIKEQG
jgi:hypothetical protein